ncbi:hypothetical protein [Bartonella bovis]|uniref:hypothetical protein n=1 Tax=Bartonella bovis TaxID=155194 RepID=UPI000C9CB1CA|nr:hypothetical protein [Bartonella bovis]
MSIGKRGWEMWLGGRERTVWIGASGRVLAVCLEKERMRLRGALDTAVEGVRGEGEKSCGKGM